MALEKKNFADAKADMQARAHNSMIENLANASLAVAEARARINERLKQELEELAELDAEIEAAAASTDALNSDEVYKLYAKANQKKFAERK